MQPLHPFLLIASGLSVGLLIGLTGVGGGALMTPLLIVGFGLSPVTAVGTDLAYASLTKVAGAWQHWRQGTVARGLVRDLAIGSVPATVAAVAMIGWLAEVDVQATERWVQSGIAVALILAAGLLARKALSSVTPVSAGEITWRRGRMIALGAVGGLLVGLTSVGSGSLIMALLVFMVPLSSEVLVGTDVAHAALLVGAAALMHLGFGHVDLVVVGWLLLGSIPGVLLGSRLAPRLPRRVLQVVLAGILFVVAVSFIR